MTGAAFQVAEDALGGFLGYLPYVAAIILVVGLMMWALAFIARYFEYLKTLESRWLDRSTLAFVHRVLVAVWIAFMVIVILAIAQSQSPMLRDALVAVVRRVPALFFAVFVVFTASIVVRVLHRFGAYLRGELKAKPKRAAPPQALAFTEIVLKYLIYGGAVVVAILGGIRALPDEDRLYLPALPGLPESFAIEVAVVAIVALVADRFSDSILEDLKRRTRKFSARVVDEFKAIARYSIWLLAGLVLLFLLLGHVLTPERLVIVTVAFVAALILLSVLAFDPVRNALAGVTLMRADAFDVGDRVKVGEDLVCDVVAMSLTLTQVRTLRGEVVHIPNTRILQQPLLNFSRSKPYAVFVDLPVGFGIEHGRVSDLLVQVARGTEGIVADPPPRVYGKDFGAGAVVYQLLAYTDRPERMKEIKSDLVFRIQDAFRAEGIHPVPVAAHV